MDVVKVRFHLPFLTPPPSLSPGHTEFVYLSVIFNNMSPSPTNGVFVDVRACVMHMHACVYVTVCVYVHINMWPRDAY